MPYLSMTRLKLRSLRHLPHFSLHTARVVRQVQRTPGFIDGQIMFALELSAWTVVLWESDAAIRTYFTNGVHGRGQSYIYVWASEANHAHVAVDHLELPSWEEVARSLSEIGRFLTIPYPSQNHCNHIVAPPNRTIYYQRLYRTLSHL